MSPEDWREMAERNRELLAERLSWPAGAVQACRELERLYPCYRTTWADSGYRAWHGGGHGRARGQYAADPAALATLVAADYAARDHAFCATPVR